MVSSLLNSVEFCFCLLAERVCVKERESVCVCERVRGERERRKVELCVCECASI